MLAGAGVLLVVAGRTFDEIEIKFLNHRTGIGRHFQLHHGREVIPFRQDTIGYQHVALFDETEASGGTTIPSDDRCRLFGDRQGFQSLVHKCQGDFAIISDEKLDMGFDGHQDAPTIRAGHIGIVIVTMISVTFRMGVFPVMVGVVMIMVVLRVIVIMIGMVVIMVIFRTADQADGNGGEQGGEEMRFFHEIRRFELGVYGA